MGVGGGLAGAHAAAFAIGVGIGQPKTHPAPLPPLVPDYTAIGIKTSDQLVQFNNLARS